MTSLSAEFTASPEHLTLNLLLHGCEIWVLTAPLCHKLNGFPNHRVRAMALTLLPLANFQPQASDRSLANVRHAQQSRVTTSLSHCLVESVLTLSHARAPENPQR
jgi:hypothetical protein